MSRGSAGVKCDGCGRPYEKGPDLVVSDANWARIAQNGERIFCPNCMHDAFVALGAPDGSVEAAFTSGPFANITWRKPK